MICAPQTVIHVRPLLPFLVLPLVYPIPWVNGKDGGVILWSLFSTIFFFILLFSFFILSSREGYRCFCPLSRGVRAYTYYIVRSTGTDRQYAYDDAYAGSSIASPGVYPSTPYLSIYWSVSPEEKPWKRKVIRPVETIQPITRQRPIFLSKLGPRLDLH